MNQFTMTDKNKRLEKILKKKGIKGWLKPVDSLENRFFVLVEIKAVFITAFYLEQTIIKLYWKEVKLIHLTLFIFSFIVIKETY